MPRANATTGTRARIARRFAAQMSAPGRGYASLTECALVARATMGPTAACRRALPTARPTVSAKTSGACVTRGTPVPTAPRRRVHRTASHRTATAPMERASVRRASSAPIACSRAVPPDAINGASVRGVDASVSQAGVGRTARWRSARRAAMATATVVMTPLASATVAMRVPTARS